MNLPNKLSIARVLCIPAIVALLYLSSDTCRMIAAGLFIIGCLTDFLDGRIARKQNLVTDFGKFIDPVADKLLADKGKVIAANIWGKIKTVTQMIAIVGVFCGKACGEFSFIPSFAGHWLMIVSYIMLYTAVGATVFSGVKYMYDAREFFRDA